MNLGLEGKTAIVTGGASNIGKAICMKFAQEGANVVVVDWDEAQAKAVSEEIAGMGKQAIAVKTDVTDDVQVNDMVAMVVEKYGNIDILVNSVGGTLDDYFMKENKEKWAKTVNMNLWSVIHCTRSVLDRMVEQNSGSIVSVGSDAGRAGEFREAVYAASKGGVIAFSKSLAKELGRNGIRFNVVCPGLTPPKPENMGKGSHWQAQIDTFTDEVLKKAVKAYPLRKIGTADDTANAVIFLASDCAGNITGQTLSVSGGYTMM
ncbi:MAG: short-chain dehydrogenase [Deltaproteobacteria bacterium]|nr:MAG: short-chain dehydrogenase [Deltaproteobacteria bacterium]